MVENSKTPKCYHQNHPVCPEGLSKILVSFSFSLGSFSLGHFFFLVFLKLLS